MGSQRASHPHVLFVTRKGMRVCVARRPTNSDGSLPMLGRCCYRGGTHRRGQTKPDGLAWPRLCVCVHRKCWWFGKSPVHPPSVPEVICKVFLPSESIGPVFVCMLVSTFRTRRVAT